MTHSRLDILKPYDHLVGSIDHVTLYGMVDDLREGDLVLDGGYWVKKISEGQHDGRKAWSVQLAPLEFPGLSAGRLVLTEGLPISFARPVEYETWEPQTTDMVPGVNYSSATATLTSELSPGDFVGWVEGNPHADDSECRVRRVVKVWVNGLIQFEDGAYQSTPSHSWYVLDLDTRDDDQVLLKVRREFVCDSAHASVDTRDGAFVSTNAEAPFIQWRDVASGDTIRYETAEIPKAADAYRRITARFPENTWDTLFEKWCNEAKVDSPFFHDRRVKSLHAGVGDDEVVVSFDDSLGDLHTSESLYTTYVPSKAPEDE